MTLISGSKLAADVLRLSPYLSCHDLQVSTITLIFASTVFSYMQYKAGQSKMFFPQALLQAMMVIIPGLFYILDIFHLTPRGKISSL